MVDLSKVKTEGAIEVASLIAKELEEHFKLYPDARLWITKLAYSVYQASTKRLIEWLDEDCDCPTNAKDFHSKRHGCWKCMIKLAKEMESG